MVTDRDRGVIIVRSARPAGLERSDYPGSPGRSPGWRRLWLALLVGAVILVLSMAALAAGMPFLLSPPGPPPRVDPSLADGIATRFNVRSPVGTVRLELSGAEANAFLAKEVDKLRGETERSGAPLVPSAAYVRFRPGRLVMNLEVQTGTGNWPRYLAGRPIGLEAEVVPRLNGQILVLQLASIRLGRMPLPPGWLLGLAEQQVKWPQGVTRTGSDSVAFNLSVLLPAGSGRPAGMSLERDRLQLEWVLDGGQGSGKR